MRSVLKWSWRIFRIVVLVYLGVILLLLFLENRLVYFPVAAATDWEKPLNDTWQDVYFDSSDGSKIHGWWCPTERADAVLLYCHGNAGNLSHRRDIIPFFQQELNVSVLIFDYPGYGKSTGSPSEPGCYAAGEAALHWLSETKKIPPERVILFGNSLGGGIATHLAVTHPHRALILSKTFSSIPDVGQRQFPFLPVRWLMRTRFDNLGRISKTNSPVIITHGKRDPLVPFSHAEQLYQAANSPKLLFPIEHGDHDSGLPLEFFHAARSFLQNNGAHFNPLAGD